jgi:hypothetical protein
VLLNWLWVLGLTDDLQEIIIRQEVETREKATLSLEILTQVLLDVLQLLVQLLENVDKALNNQSAVGILFLVDSFHFNLEVLVHLVKKRAFLRQLFRD